jgi:hypothetical protein
MFGITMSTAWTSLATELRAHDQLAHFASSLDHPVNTLVNGSFSAKPYQEILIRSLDWPMETRELEMVVRALTEKGMTTATDRLLMFFKDNAKRQASGLLWAVGNALHTIAPHDHLTEVLTICQNCEWGRARQMLVLHLSRFKNTEQVFQTLISLLQDESVKGHALEALWRYGDSRAIPAIEATPVQVGLYEANAKNTALKRLKKAEQGGSANGSQPICSKINRTSSADGFRR